MTRSSKKPLLVRMGQPLVAAAAISSCSSRVTPNSFAVMAAWSPMDSPVRGSALRGITGTICPGRRRPSSFTRSPALLAALRSSSTRRRSSLISIGASLAVSAPPAIPLSSWPRAILFATSTVAARLVSQACWTS